MNVKPDRAAWFKGGEASCNVSPQQSLHPLRLVLLGPPGVGKGTQAELFSQRFDACQLSTGDVFRNAKEQAARCECSPALLRVLAHMDAGELVPDETVLAVVAERVKCLRCEGGFLLDGFPRTLAQAEALVGILKENNVVLDAVLRYELPVEKIIARLSGRRTCSQCEKIYHLEARPPKVAGVCDDCGAELFHREDDRPEAVSVRLDAYQKRTLPLVDFYSRAGLLVSIAVAETPEVTYARTLVALEARRQSGTTWLSRS